ncbi:hypothetical protein SAMN02745124_01202 [Desulfofustis glycolicus DSM 9705]|uniref:Uncharacterized protein n=2 Tax=Desulfofustis glycolicus TaxID=51195 RepID=A0A1M5UJZ0_9BACT|nr:hypothetical protein SAMN02745124_01202 [Desulfofustis glycolicus DSM 9705]
MAKSPKNKGSERGTYITTELIHSDAFRSLSSSQKDIWLFVLTRRVFGKDAKGKRDYTKLLNKSDLKAPAAAIQEFFDGPIRNMEMPSYNADTIRKAFKKFLEVGFLSVLHLGGNGPGDQSVYQFEDKWKHWKAGDPACFSKQGMARGKGFCQPNSGVFFTKAAKNKGCRSTCQITRSPTCQK